MKNDQRKTIAYTTLHKKLIISLHFSEYIENIYRLQNKKKTYFKVEKKGILHRLANVQYQKILYTKKNALLKTIRYANT